MIYTILYNIYVYTYQSSNSASTRHQTWDEGDGYDQKVHKTMHVISNWHAKSVRRLKSSRRSITITTAMQKIAWSSGRSQSIHISYLYWMSELIQVILKNVLHVSIRGWFELQVSILGASSLDGLGVYMDASNENAARVHRGLSVAEWDSKMYNAYNAYAIAAIHITYT